MEIQPETVKKVAYPVLAVVAATALSACDPQSQRTVGKEPAADRTEPEMERTSGYIVAEPQHVDGIPPVPETELQVPEPPKPDEDQQLPGEPVEIPSRVEH